MEHPYSKLLLILFAYCTLILQSCKKAEEPSAKPETVTEPEAQHHINLPTTRVVATIVEKLLSFPGKVTAPPDHSVLVTPNISGKITKVLVVPGQHVAKGQLVALLDDRQLVAQIQQSIAPERAALNMVEQAKISLDLAEKNLTRMESLFAKDIVAEKDVIAARSQVELGKSQVEAAQAKVSEIRLAPLHLKTQLAFTRVVSPISGTVAQRFLNVGDTADLSKPIVHIVDLSTVIIDANMPADLPADLKVGHRAVITSVASPGVKYGAQIIAISPVVDTANNTVSVQLLAQNAQGRLKEGQQVNVSIVYATQRAILVPKSALVPGSEDPSEHFVYVVRDGKLSQTKVGVGDPSGGSIPVFDGLKSGDEIITSGAYGVPEGTILDRGEPSK